MDDPFGSLLDVLDRSHRESTGKQSGVRGERVIIDDPAYHAILDQLNVITKDDHLYIDVSSLVMVNESIIGYVIANRDNLTEDQYWSMASILESYKAMLDTLTNKYAKELVPDDVSELTDE